MLQVRALRDRVRVEEPVRAAGRCLLVVWEAEDTSAEEVDVLALGFVLEIAIVAVASKAPEYNPGAAHTILFSIELVQHLPVSGVHEGNKVHPRSVKHVEDEYMSVAVLAVGVVFVAHSATDDEECAVGQLAFSKAREAHIKKLVDVVSGDDAHCAGDAA